MTAEQTSAMAIGATPRGGMGRTPAFDPEVPAGDRRGDAAPGEPHEDDHGVTGALRTYVVGLALAGALSAALFILPATGAVWGPGLPIALLVLAVAQIGVHLLFFLHITTAPDNTNNFMALAFGVLIVFLLVAGSLWIMSHLNSNMMPMEQMMNMQR